MCCVQHCKCCIMSKSRKRFMMGAFGKIKAHMVRSQTSLRGKNLIALQGCSEYNCPRMEISFLYLAFYVGIVLLCSAAAYLIGSVPFGYLAGKLNGVDLREHGSCNIGATNAVRVLGKKWGIPVFVCDFLKGLLPLLGVRLMLGMDVTQMDIWQASLFICVMISLVLGHTYTCFLGFKGGKGVATTAGCLFALPLTIGVTAAVTWVLMMIITRYVSLSSMLAGVAMVSAALHVLWVEDGECSAADALILSVLFIVLVLVIYKHRSNIERLCAGTEPKAFSKKKS